MSSEATTTFRIMRARDVPHTFFLRFVMEPAIALHLHGQVVRKRGVNYYFRFDGSSEAAKQLLSYLSIGAPAYGVLRDVILWIDDAIYRDHEALLMQPDYLQAARDNDDAVVPFI